MSSGIAATADSVRRAALGDRLVVEVAGRGPGAEPFHRWISHLPRAPAGSPADVRWRPAGPGEEAGARRDPEGRWELWGPGHHPLAAIQDVLVGKGASLVHACGLSVEGRGVIVTGAAGAGKTLASLWALSAPGVRLVSDDLVVVGADGQVAPFPTPLALRDYHRPLLADPSVLDRGTALSRLVRLAAAVPGVRPAARAARRWLAGRRGAVASAVARVKTDYTPVPPGRLFPTERMAGEQQAALCVVLDANTEPGELEPARAAWIAAAFTYANEGLGAALERYGAGGVIDFFEHRRRANEVLNAFAASVACVGARPAATGDVLADQRHIADVIRAALGRT